MGSSRYKFRAWDKDNNRMIYPDPLSAHPLYMTWEGIVYEYGVVKNYVIMQSTGLKDKHGKEIYEGDVLSFVPVGHRRFNNPYKPFVVSWDEKDARFLDWSPRDSVEIIGDIYSNPELIQEGEKDGCK